MNFYKRFIGDIQAKTGHLSCTEMGVYDRLLDHYYATEAALQGGIEACCRIARAMSKMERGAVESILRQFFELGADGAYRQKRTEEMIAEAQPKIQAARANGKRGGRPRTQTKPTGFQTDNPAETEDEPNAKASQSQNQSSLRSDEKPRKRGAGFDAAGIELPDWLDRDLWGEWVADRRERGKVITERAAAQQLKSLDEYRCAGHSPERTIRHAIASGNQGLYPPPRLQPNGVTGMPIAQVTVPSDAAERTQAYLREQFKPFTAEEKAAADEARKRAMASLGRTA